MPVGDDTTYFAGKSIKVFRIAEGIVDPASFAYNISYKKTGASYPEEWGEPCWREKWLAFLKDPRVSEISALVISGDMEQVQLGESCAEQIESLVSGRAQLPALTSLCLGYDDCLNHDDEWLFSLPDITPIFQAFPRLEELRLYGWTHRKRVTFQIGTIHSEKLRSLCIATAWLKPRILHDLWRAHLPALEHLELWLYAAYQDNPPTVDDVAPLFSGRLFPRLRSLTLSYSEIGDDLAVALAASPLLGQLKVLELSMGILTDRGAQALLASPMLRQLEKLVISYHYCSDEVVRQIRALPLEVEIDEPQDVKNTYRGVPEIYMDIFHI